MLKTIGTVAAFFFGIWVTARFTSYDAYDAVFARSGWSYRQKISYLRAHPHRTLGLGAATAGLLAIPIVNLVAMPVAAAAATLAYHRP